MSLEQLNIETNKLALYITEHKKKLVESVLANRTRYITLVLEDLFHEHNASAVIRTADCYGIQDIHAVEKHNQFRMDRGIDKGASKWINLKKYTQIEACMSALKSKGYTIAAATPHAKAEPISSLSLRRPTALIFGAERVGLSEYVMRHADKYITIPMFGFTQSFNVSVSAAVCLEHIMSKVRSSNINWHLTEVEQARIRYEWYRRIIGSKY